MSAAALVVLWAWIDSLRFADVDKRATAHLEAVKVASAIAVGGGGLFALYLAARRQRTQELELEVRRAELQGRDFDAAERRVTELYAKAADQLGSDKAPVRLAGMYALDRLANDNLQHRQMVIDLLCAYLRMPSAVAESASGATAEERQVRLAAQDLLASRTRPYLDLESHSLKNARHWPELYELNLAGARLIDLDLSGCHIGRGVFADAVFTGETVFTEVVFESGAQFAGAEFGNVTRFDDARIEVDADFINARFSGFVNFSRTSFPAGAVFQNAELGEACYFNSAKFELVADFGEATFGEIDFSEAVFARRAEFDKATFRGPATFEGARFDDQVFFEDAVGKPAATSTFIKKPIWPDGWGLGEAGEGEWHSFERS